MAKYYINAQAGLESVYPYDSAGTGAVNLSTLFTYGNIQPGDDIIIFKPNEHIDGVMDPYDVKNDFNVVIPFSVNIYAEGNSTNQAHIAIPDRSGCVNMLMYFGEGSSDCTITGITFYKYFWSDTSSTALNPSMNVPVVIASGLITTPTPGSFINIVNTANIKFESCKFIMSSDVDVVNTPHTNQCVVMYSNDITFNNCSFSCVGDGGTYTNLMYLIYCTNTKIVGCTFKYDISRPMLSGIWNVQSSNLVFNNNYCYQYLSIPGTYVGGPSGFLLSQPGSSAVPACDIYNNVFESVLVPDDGNDGSLNGIVQLRCGSNNKIKKLFIYNNVFYATENPTLTYTSAIKYNGISTESNTSEYDACIFNNIFYTSSTVGNIKMAAVGAKSGTLAQKIYNNIYYGLTLCVSASPQNPYYYNNATSAHNISGVDPGFAGVQLSGDDVRVLSTFFTSTSSVCNGRGINGTKIGLLSDLQDGTNCTLSDSLILAKNPVFNVSNLPYKTGEIINNTSIRCGYTQTIDEVNSRYSYPKYLSGASDYYYNIFNLSSVDSSAIPFATGNVLYGSDLNTVLKNKDMFDIVEGIHSSATENLNFGSPNWIPPSEYDLFGVYRL